MVHCKNQKAPERIRRCHVNGGMDYVRILRDLREDADLTQAQVGERLGLSQRTYAYYESGQRMVPPEVLCALGDLYGVSVDYLLGRTDCRLMNR